MKKAVYLIAILFIYLLSINVYAENCEEQTIVYFNAKITKTYGNGDMMLLENTDISCNKKYGIIDAGRKVNTTNSTATLDFLNNFSENGEKIKIDFLLITHSHGDHNGDALSILDNYEVSKIFMKDADNYYSSNDMTQSTYEDIIKLAMTKQIPIYGVDYNSTISSTLSPSASSDFINYMSSTSEYNNYLIPFTDRNTSFSFGSANIKMYNWEIFDNLGNIWNKTESSSREITVGENSNSITLLLTQGNKKGFFSGDMNNYDSDVTNGKLADEDRLKDVIGKVDFLKMGHHGYAGSNTIDYLNTLKPSYAMFTNDPGKPYIETLNWVNSNNVKYLYTTEDDIGTYVLFKNNRIEIGYMQGDSFRKVNNEFYYIPKNNTSTDNLIPTTYTQEYITASNWEELKNIIDSNKSDYEYHDGDSSLGLKELFITLSSGDYSATSNITIAGSQKIHLICPESISFNRDSSLINNALFDVYGSLSIGENSNEFIIDGKNIESQDRLINIHGGILNVYSSVILKNNYYNNTKKIYASTTQSYTTMGSALYSDEQGTINMYGGLIENNKANNSTILTQTNKNLSNAFALNTFGGAVYIRENSIFNMYDGAIKNNTVLNESTVNANGSTSTRTRGYEEESGGAAIGAFNSVINLNGNNTIIISGNKVVNSPSLNMTNSNLYSLNNTLYGGVIYSSGGKLILKNVNISNTNITENASLTYDSESSLRATYSNAVRGGEIYSNGSDITIENVSMDSINITSNKTDTNGLSIGSKSLSDVGGGFDLIHGNMTINGFSISNHNANHGGGLYISDAESLVSIENLNISGCSSTAYGGGVYITSSDVIINNSSISSNSSNNGGGIYAAKGNNSLLLNNINATNNTATTDGGGVYVNGGTLNISKNSKINNNVANRNGGGLQVGASSTSAIIDSVTMNRNSAQSSGGGIYNDNKLTLTNSTLTNNIAGAYGGGVYYKDRIFYSLDNNITGNSAENEGNETYPTGNSSEDTNNPTLTVIYQETTWTRENIYLNISATDAESGIKEITINNKVLTSDTYEVTKNGNYVITAEDNMGNKATKNITISKIDKTNPQITGVNNNSTYNEDVTINATDNISGIASYSLTKNNDIVTYTLGNKIDDDGNYQFTITDNAGNTASLSFTINKKINDNLYDYLNVEQDTNKWTNENMTLTLSPKNNVSKVYINNEEIVFDNNSYIINVNENNTYKLKVMLNDGTIYEEDYIVNNIDKNAPQILGAENGKSYDTDVTIIINDEISGIKSFVVTKNNEKIIFGSGETLKENGSYHVEAYDNAGNKKEISFTINKAIQDDDDEDTVIDDNQNYDDYNNSINVNNDINIENPPTGKDSHTAMIIFTIIVSCILIYILKIYNVFKRL